MRCCASTTSRSSGLQEHLAERHARGDDLRLAALVRREREREHEVDDLRVRLRGDVRRQRRLQVGEPLEVQLAQAREAVQAARQRDEVVVLHLENAQLAQLRDLLAEDLELVVAQLQHEQPLQVLDRVRQVGEQVVAQREALERLQEPDLHGQLRDVVLVELQNAQLRELADLDGELSERVVVQVQLDQLRAPLQHLRRQRLELHPGLVERVGRLVVVLVVVDARHVLAQLRVQPVLRGLPEPDRDVPAQHVLLLLLLLLLK